MRRLAVPVGVGVGGSEGEGVGVGVGVGGSVSVFDSRIAAGRIADRVSVSDLGSKADRDTRTASRSRWPLPAAR